MTSTRWMRRAAYCLVASASMFAVALSLQAQSYNSNLESSSSAGFGDDAQLSVVRGSANFLAPDLLRAAIVGASENAGGGGGRRDRWSHASEGKLALEFGAGFNAPIGNDQPYITWGGNFTIGAGLHLTNRLSVLGEYQFMDDKLPGAFIYDVTQAQANGNAYINSLTISPVVDLFPKRVNSVYLTGGFGWYHKKTEFTETVGYDYYGYPIDIVTDEFSSDQWGGNAGLGYTHKLGGRYSDGRLKLYAEARYTFLHTPPLTANNGLGTTEVIPVTLGFRW